MQAELLRKKKNVMKQIIQIVRGSVNCDINFESCHPTLQNGYVKLEAES